MASCRVASEFSTRPTLIWLRSSRKTTKMSKKKNPAILAKSSRCQLGPVHTYTDIFESATFSLRIRLPSTRIRRIRQRIRKKINTLSKVEKNISATNPLTCGQVNPDIFLSDDVKSTSSVSPNNREF